MLFHAKGCGWQFCLTLDISFTSQLTLVTKSSSIKWLGEHHMRLIKPMCNNQHEHDLPKVNFFCAISQINVSPTWNRQWLAHLPEFLTTKIQVGRFISKMIISMLLFTSFLVFFLTAGFLNRVCDLVLWSSSFHFTSHNINIMSRFLLASHKCHQSQRIMDELIKPHFYYYEVCNNWHVGLRLTGTWLMYWCCLSR